MIGVLCLMMSLPFPQKPYTVQQFLEIKAAWSPKPHPKGQWVAYLSNITGTPQIWRLDLPQGCPTQVTFFEERIAGFRVAPDGSVLAFLTDQGGNERYQIYLTTPTGDRLWQLTDAPDAIHYLGDWSRDGRFLAYVSNRRDPAVFDVYVLDLQTGKERRVWETNGYYTALAFSPDARFLVVRQSRSNFDEDLFLLDLQTGEHTYLTPHQGFAQYQNVRFSPDGQSLYLLTDQDREFLNPARLDLRTRSLTYLDNRPWDYEEFEITQDGTRMAAFVNEAGYSKFLLMDLTTGKIQEIPGLPQGNAGGLAWLEEGPQLFFHVATPTQTWDLWRYSLKDQTFDQLTVSSTAGIPPNLFVAPQPVRYRSFDGLEIPGFLYLPRSTSTQKPPVIVYVHGGPESQYRPGFSPLFQYFLYRGYAVFAPNVRGSAGYGRTYLHLDDREKRLDAVRDLAEGVRWLKQSGLIDPHRVAVMGASYGGYMVLAGLTFYPDLFAAGIDIVGIANFKTFLERTGPYRRRLREAEYGSLDDEDLLRQISPIHYIDRIRAPLFIIHGRNDPRVPVYEAEQIYQALKAKNQPVELVIYEDEGHGLSKLKNRIDAYTRVVDFLDRVFFGTASPSEEKP